MGYLSVGPNNSENSGDIFTIAASDQIAGTNLLTFAQTVSPAYVWGVTDISLTEIVPPDLTLVVGTLDAGQYGNRYAGNTDADGIITADFEGSASNLQLALTGYDIDFATEVEVSLNGSSLGYLSVGPNNSANVGDTFSIAAGDQIAGTNLLTFAQTASPTYIWGVTDLLLSEIAAPDITLAVGTLDTGQYGNKFAGTTDTDGIITAGFEGSESDLELSLTGHDIDFATEVEVNLNGNSLGFLSVGPNNAQNAGDTFTLAADAQLAGTNILTFEQTVSATYRWGITDLLLAELPPPGTASQLSDLFPANDVSGTAAGEGDIGD